MRTPKPQQAVDPTSFRIAVTGSTGLVGSALVPYLTGRGHKVSRMVRKTPAPGSSDIRWDPARGQLEADDLEGFDAIIHLAGEPVAPHIDGLNGLAVLQILAANRVVLDIPGADHARGVGPGAT